MSLHVFIEDVDWMSAHTVKVLGQGSGQQYQSVDRVNCKTEGAKCISVRLRRSWMPRLTSGDGRSLVWTTRIESLLKGTWMILHPFLHTAPLHPRTDENLTPHQSPSARTIVTFLNRASLKIALFRIVLFSIVPRAYHQLILTSP